MSRITADTKIVTHHCYRCVESCPRCGPPSRYTVVEYGMKPSEDPERESAVLRVVLKCLGCGELSNLDISYEEDQADVEIPVIRGGDDTWCVHYLGDDGTPQIMVLGAENEIDAAAEVRVLFDIPDSTEIEVDYD